jgi:hypothetical protein
MSIRGPLTETERELLQVENELSGSNESSTRKRVRKKIEELPKLVERTLKDLELLLKFYKEDYEANRRLYDIKPDKTDAELNRLLGNNFPELVFTLDEEDHRMIFYRTFTSLRLIWDPETFSSFIEDLEQIEEKFGSIDNEATKELYEDKKNTLDFIDHTQPLLNKHEREMVYSKLEEPSFDEIKDIDDLESKIQDLKPELWREDEGNLAIKRRQHAKMKAEAKNIYLEMKR